ncbi:MAG TPA: hypothetical protein VGL35_10320 [Rhizomicrobium sp.]|jgi:hypothetical protein
MLSRLGDNPELLLAVPEHKVALPGSRRGESQNDLFLLARIGSETFAITVEGKVNESFDKPLDEWLANASEGKRERLAFLCEILELISPIPGDIPYQLLHRTASAIIEARRFRTDADFTNSRSCITSRRLPVASRGPPPVRSQPTVPNLRHVAQLLLRERSADDSRKTIVSS